MGTPDFAVPALENLCKSKNHVQLVVTQKDRPRGRGKKVQYPAVKEKALEFGIEVYQPDNVNSKESLEKIKKLSPDLIVVAAFGQILKKELLDIPKYGCINIHASLLPKYRGAAPINWAIINGEKETGITIMEMEEGLDTGPIMKKRSIPILPEDNSGTIHDKLALLGGELILETIDDISKGRAIKTPQDHSKSTYAPMIYRDTGKINWNDTGTNIKNLVRGVNPWPGAYTIYEGQTMKIFNLALISGRKEGKAGQIVKVSQEGIYVNTGDNTAIIKELQFPNKRRMTVREYLAGNEIKLGSILK